MNYRGSTRSERARELRYLTDEQLRHGIEAMFFAYRQIIYDPDMILTDYGYGRAHHRAMHFIRYHDRIGMSELLDILAISRQSLNRVLRDLIRDGMVRIETGAEDRRRRHVLLTGKGVELADRLFSIQRDRLRKAYRRAGPEAVAGFREVLEMLVDTRGQDV